MNKFFKIAALSLLLLSSCDDDDIYLNKNSWICTQYKGVPERHCDQTAMDLKFGREGTCKTILIQECVQWTKK